MGNSQKTKIMKITYDTDVDLLYIRFDTRKQKVTNQTVNDNIIFDMGKNGSLVGIEILDASKIVNLEQLFPVVKEPAYGIQTEKNQVA